MKIIFGSDHGGGELMQFLADSLKNSHDVILAHLPTKESVDYPDRVSHAVRVFREEKGQVLVLVCGSGVGVSIAANRHRGIRAVVTDNPYIAELSRQHNHANCLCLGERITGKDLALRILNSFLHTDYDLSLRHSRRVEKLEELEV